MDFLHTQRPPSLFNITGDFLEKTKVDAYLSHTDNMQNNAWNFEIVCKTSGFRKGHYAKQVVGTQDTFKVDFR